MKTNYLSKEETWAENYSIYKINCKIFCKGIQNQKLKNQPTNLPLPNLKQNFFFFLPEEFLLEAPFLHSWDFTDFTVFFTTASTSHLKGHLSKFKPWLKLLNFSDLTRTGVSNLVLP